MEIIVNDSLSYVKTTIELFCAMELLKPNVQRLVDIQHVNDIVSYQIDHYKKHKLFSLGGPFIVAELNKQLYLLDGHHRLASLKRLIKFFVSEDVGKLNIVYQLQKLKTKNELKEYFSAICHNMPIDEWHMDILNIREDEEQERQLKIKEKADCIIELFNKKFPDILKTTNRPQRPNIRRDDFYRTIMNDPDLLKISQDKYFNKILECNEKCKKEFDHNKFSKVTCVKFEKSGCYLSIENYKAKKIAIPKYIRIAVWNQEFGDKTEGECKTCHKVLSIHHYEVGHIISEANGGGMELDNLTIQCSMCNKSAGRNNL